ncbi:hypothetical protein [Winogradskyella sp.]|uniref:hypothetical protein n=1 Tax=Winogradskyella sp. TaxID=1883156 RepID=UPI00262B1777|nr:hypothetical protein [Winogradskyella sp.]
MIKQFINKITAILLVFVLLANNINTIVIVADFVINQDIIAATLCIQKKEQKSCNGKCYLRKELSKASKKAPNESRLAHQFTELSYFLKAPDASIQNVTLSTTHNKSFIFSSCNLHPRLLVLKIAHPPEFA